MKFSVLCSFLVTWIASARSVEFYQNPYGHMSIGRGSYPSFSHQPFPQHSPGFGQLRSFPSHPIRSPRAIPYRSFPSYLMNRRFPSRPSLRVYGQRPSYFRGPSRSRTFRTRQFPSISGFGSFPSSSRIIPRRISSPRYRPSLTGSRRRIQRLPTFRQGAFSRVSSGRRSRARQPITHPIIPRNPADRNGEQIIALFAVDDPRNRRGRSRGRSGSLSRISLPRLSETMDKGVKVTPIKKKTGLNGVAKVQSISEPTSGITVAGKKTAIVGSNKIANVVTPIVEAEKVTDMSTATEIQITSNDNNNANADAENSAILEATVVTGDADIGNAVIETVVEPAIIEVVANIAVEPIATEVSAAGVVIEPFATEESAADVVIVPAATDVVSDIVVEPVATELVADVAVEPIVSELPTADVQVAQGVIVEDSVKAIVMNKAADAVVAEPTVVEETPVEVHVVQAEVPVVDAETAIVVDKAIETPL